ncbi:baseplate assembly protein [Gluconobacter sp. LMG 31484]|uniref:Baseplate assembly protein n=1 Tax=Gluconobacter vitians TaxID=2728102 RepID=A0ABR9Y3V8_9PROT|nr:Gp138 family membrane-puncturing spike protein [Gluconobacter vitians]MBF0858149.1 baseplate assembly protein [Gluconobacter vitians]
MSGTASSFVGITQGNTDSSAIDAAVRRNLSDLGTNVLVQVSAVHAGNGIVGTVDVTPMVHQQTSDGTAVPHGTIYGVPYLRIQGGTCAVIVDPVAGDIGYIIISGRDQSNVVATRAPALPGSFRQHSMADCVYVGGFLNEAPAHYVQITTDGVRIVTTGKVTVQASEMDVNCNLNVSGTIKATGDVQAGSVSLESHVHGGVQSGSSNTTPPK